MNLKNLRWCVKAVSDIFPVKVYVPRVYVCVHA